VTREADGLTGLSLLISYESGINQEISVYRQPTCRLMAGHAGDGLRESTP
jgi:hypothetical protein